MGEQVSQSHTKPIAVHGREIASKVRQRQRQFVLKTKTLLCVWLWCVGDEYVTGAMAKRTDRGRVDNTR